MIQMRGEQDDVPGQRRVAAGQPTHRVPRSRRHAGLQISLQAGGPLDFKTVCKRLLRLMPVLPLLPISVMAMTIDPAGRLYIFDERVKRIQVYQ